MNNLKYVMEHLKGTIATLQNTPCIKIKTKKNKNKLNKRNQIKNPYKRGKIYKVKRKKKVIEKSHSYNYVNNQRTSRNIP